MVEYYRNPKAEVEKLEREAKLNRRLQEIYLERGDKTKAHDVGFDADLATEKLAELRGEAKPQPAQPAKKDTAATSTWRERRLKKKPAQLELDFDF